MKITITPATATRAISLIAHCGTPEQAAHDCRVQLQALGHYTDRALSAVLRVLELIARNEGDARARLLVQLERIASGEVIA
jgi:hypothetical protein